MPHLSGSSTSPFPVVPSLSAVAERVRASDGRDLETLHGERPTSAAFLKADEVLRIDAKVAERTSSGLFLLGQQFVNQVGEQRFSVSESMHLLDGLLRRVTVDPQAPEAGGSLNPTEQSMLMAGVVKGLQAWSMGQPIEPFHKEVLSSVSSFNIAPVQPQVTRRATHGM